MKIDCEVIQDLLPLYVEKIASEKSEKLIEEHFIECENCKKKYAEMKMPEPQLELKQEPAENFQKYIQKKKRKTVWKVILIVLGAVVASMTAEAIVWMGIFGLLIADSSMASVEEYTDVAYYEDYMGENAEEEFVNKWGMDETIFPEEITTDMNVLEYKMVYYNPWDAQYLSYLTVEYDEADYEVEKSRLENYDSTDYIGNYGVTGFAEEDNPIAMYADDYQGFVYAIRTPGRENTITYVELIFCNYYMDLDYTQYIPVEYLPEGFDATSDNEYQKNMMEY
ncbi:MAG: zf-HC2 domain-containing protein [Lachnospiraceae bacterium]|nr:zf-HC2 domain-containing protein [Lachnospiraceae bacterium]